MQIRRVLALIAILALSVGALSTAAQAQKNDNKNQPNQPKRSKTEQQDVDLSVAMVDRVLQGAQPAPTDYTLTWESNHSTKGQEGQTYLPYTLVVDKALAGKQVAFYTRVIEKGAAPPALPDPKAKDSKAPPARPSYPWERITFAQVPDSGKMSRAFVLKPGDYDVYFTLKEKSTAEIKDLSKAAPPKMAFFKRELSVPDYNGDLKMSAPILASTVEPLTTPFTPAQMEENPYGVFGAMKIVPSVDGKFSKAGEFSIVFFVYNAGDAGAGKPNVTLEYSFYVKQGEGEKYFNKTAPQELNGTTLSPDFNVAAGHQVPGMLSIPLASFPAGDYRLEIKVTDKAANKTITQNVAFTVTA
jgi:hypothetical protein